MGGTNIEWNASISIETFDMNNQTPMFRPNDWGRNDDDLGTRWLHGDLKNMAFYYNFKLFENVTMKGNLK